MLSDISDFKKLEYLKDMSFEDFKDLRRSIDPERLETLQKLKKSLKPEDIKKLEILQNLAEGLRAEDIENLAKVEELKQQQHERSKELLKKHQEKYSFEIDEAKKYIVECYDNIIGEMQVKIEKCKESLKKTNGNLIEMDRKKREYRNLRASLSSKELEKKRELEKLDEMLATPYGLAHLKDLLEQYSQTGSSRPDRKGKRPMYPRTDLNENTSFTEQENERGLEEKHNELNKARNWLEEVPHLHKLRNLLEELTAPDKINNLLGNHTETTKVPQEPDLKMLLEDPFGIEMLTNELKNLPDLEKLTKYGLLKNFNDAEAELRSDQRLDAIRQFYALQTWSDEVEKSGYDGLSQEDKDYYEYS